VDSEKSLPMTLRMPGMDAANWAVRRIENGKAIRVTPKPPGITFTVKPGDYEIRRLAK